MNRMKQITHYFMNTSSLLSPSECGYRKLFVHCVYIVVAGKRVAVPLPTLIRINIIL